MTPETETHASIPSSVIESIYTTLLEASNVKVPYSNDPLKMAQTAIEQQKESITRVLALIMKHCFYPPYPPEEPEP